MAQTARRTRRSAEMHDDEDDPTICTHAGNKMNSRQLPTAASVPLTRRETGGAYARLRKPFPGTDLASTTSLLTDHYAHVVLARLHRLAMQRRVDFTHFSRISQE